VNNNNGKLFFEDTQGNKRPVGRPKTPIEYTSPYPTAYNFSGEREDPQAIKTELTTLNQIRKDEGTLIWGVDDALPLHILNAIAQSPTTTSCIGKLEQFTRGEAFSDESLMDLVINKDGETLWDLHCQLVHYFVQLDAFSTNFKFNSEGKITNTYCMDTASIRFKAEAETNEITGIKYNPYFGSSEYKRADTTEYSLFDLEKLGDQIKKQGTKFMGQVYFHGTKRPLYKHYPVPKFWAGSKWIYSDAKLATYIDTMLDNGFFSSVLMNVIGDPNKMSKHPDSMREVTGTDGTIRKEPTKTEGEVFGEMMASNFSGVQKAAKALVTWSMNKDQSVNIQAFPTNTNFEFVAGTLRETIRMITIATEVPGVLANLPDEVSPLAGQDAMARAIEFTQSNTAGRRTTLENFYNNILIPNLATTTKARVQIKSFSPAKVAVTIDDKFWQFMNEAEKIDFITRNEPNVVINRPPAAMDNTAPATTDDEGNIISPAPTVPQVDEILKGLKVSEINRILSIVKKVNAGQLTPEQGTTILSGYGLNAEQINAFLNPQTTEV
jgi:hypothetical protein